MEKELLLTPEEQASVRKRRTEKLLREQARTWCESSFVVCAVCGAGAGWYCDCGSTLRVIRQTRRRVVTKLEATRARRRVPRPNAKMAKSLVPEFFALGIVVDVYSLETSEVARLRAAGYIQRKKRGTPKQRARRKRRLVRRHAYFNSTEGLAQSVEVRMFRIDDDSTSWAFSD